MGVPLQRELPLGEAAAVAGAAAYADARFTAWAERATGLAEQFVLGRTRDDRFQATEIRAFAESCGLPAPPDARAWGHIVRRLKKKGAIIEVGLGRSLDPKQHHGYITEWRAL